jgi:hypothetical protein
MKAVSPLCGSTERALDSWPAKQPSAVHEGASRQQTTLLLYFYVLYTIPSKSKCESISCVRQGK